MIRKDCPECGGTGWKPVEAEGVRYVTRCDCRQTERMWQLLEQARIPRRYEHCAFENFDIRKLETGHTNTSLDAAKVTAQSFVKEYPDVDIGLLFVGPTGVGKTHLAVAVLRELIAAKGVECLFHDFRDLLKAIQDSYNPVSQTSEFRVVEPVLEAEVLLLDEMAALNPSDWVKETLGYIINSRYNQKKVTLITTTIPLEANRSHQEKDASVKDTKPSASQHKEVRTPSGDPIPSFEPSLAHLGATLVSRLYEMCRIVEMRSDDARRTLKYAGYKHLGDR
jgi:DNA replication protein DnaC